MINKINPEHYFVLKDGSKIRDLNEFCTLLRKVDKVTFEFHVNDQKNDFANWISYVFKAKRLAEGIRELGYADRLDIIKRIKNHLAEKKILVVNAGSSSIKFQLLELTRRDILIKGMVDAIGLDRCMINASYSGVNVSKPSQVKNHEEGMKAVIDLLFENNIIDDLSDILAIGHRVVHGGEHFTKPTVIDENLVRALVELSSLAPLHNPANISGINACRKIFSIPQVAVFDTAFHSTIPKEKYLYGLPYEYYERYKIRKYGFHGSSHKYITSLLMQYYKIKRKKNPKFIICHLGNGSSITAVKNGKSFNTSMGFTPLDGLIMGTRSGSLDPFISIHLGTLLNISYEEMNKILNKRSGLLGISGFSDMRDLRKNQKQQRSRLAMDMFADRLIHYIGAYIAELDGVDGIAFTAGIGENAFYIRKKVLDNFKHLGLRLDERKNQKNDFIITRKDSRIECFVMTTNEELQIAQETMKALKI